jgi:hypothetical protein
MKSTVTLAIEPDTLLRLINQLRRAGGQQDLSDAICIAIRFWLDAQAAMPNGGDPANVRGYQWKSLFLPEGTVLRSWSYGEHNYAEVVGDEIIHNGRAVSPNKFAQAFARTTRNAWTDLFIRRPGDKNYIMACRLRQQVAKAPPPLPEVTGDLATQTLLAALIGAMQAPLLPRSCHASSPASAVAVAPAARPTSSTPLRDPTPGEGWTLPERRKSRFRMEDVAFD